MIGGMPRRILVRGAFGALFLFAVIHSAQVTRDATLTVRIVDAATGRPTPVRISLQDQNGVRPHTRGALAVSDSALPIPKEAIALLWGQQDRAEGYALQPDGSFYVDGAFEARVPPGEYTLTISKGFEYLRRTETLKLDAAGSAKREYRMERWADLPSRGWYSADDHIHLRRSPGDDAAMTKWIAAEDIHVGNILQMGDFWATYFSQYAFGPQGRFQAEGRILSPGQEEPRTPEIGHTISLGQREFVRMTRDYYSFDRLFDRVHELGGVTGFAHQGMSFHGYRGMALNTLRGKTDFLELAQFCVPEGPLATEHYYRFLDLGQKLTALAGSDFPWCGTKGAQIGNARFYTYVGGPLTFERWFAGMQAGHTFVTTGPMLLLTVNEKLPGDTVDVARGSKVRVRAEAFGQAEQMALRSLEIVGHGKVLGKAAAGSPARMTVELELPVEGGIWIAARCEAGPGQVAHTTPVYVTVGGGGFENRENLAQNVRIAGGYLKEVEDELARPGNALDNQAARHRAQLERQIAEARERLRAIGR
jgi:hypothetical protein